MCVCPRPLLQPHAHVVVLTQESADLNNKQRDFTISSSFSLSMSLLGPRNSPSVLIFHSLFLPVSFTVCPSVFILCVYHSVCLSLSFCPSVCLSSGHSFPPYLSPFHSLPFCLPFIAFLSISLALSLSASFMLFPSYLCLSFLLCLSPSLFISLIFFPLLISVCLVVSFGLHSFFFLPA